MYRLMIVEDDEGVALAVKARAEVWGLQVHIAGRLREVMAEFAAFALFVVIFAAVFALYRLPLAAGVHLGFVFPFITRISRVFAFDDTVLSTAVDVACFASFGVLYALVYRITSAPTMPSSAAESVSSMKKVSWVLRTAILGLALLLIVLLAIPAGVFLVPITVIWTAAEKLIRRLEGCETEKPE